MIEAFNELLDQLWWSGFADQLKEDEPARYRWELLQFLEMYE